MIFHLNRVRLDRRGYDSARRYWGTGLPLWHAWTPGRVPTIERYFRADDRPAARATLSGEFPGSTVTHP